MLSIRTRLRALILITLLPVAIFGAAGAYTLVQKERESFARGALDRVGALMTAIDAQMNASITPLEVLARSPNFDGADLAAFRAEAQRALEARRGDWVNLVVSHPETADLLMNLLVPANEPLPKALDPASIVETARSRRPTIGDVVPGSALNRPVFAVRMPVMREGKVKYVLSAIVEISVIAALIERQKFPDTWAVAVLDGNYSFVVRRPTPPSNAGAAPSESLKKALEGSAQGWQRGQLLDGSEIYRAFQRSTLSRWSIAFPRAVVDESLKGVWLLLAGFAGAAVLGLWIAWRLASRISQPIAALAAAAPALARGDPSALAQPASVDEVSELSRALADAAAAIRDREERQRQAEQSLRQVDRAKDEFLAMLGHELRNPLAAVSNAARLLKIARHQPAVLDDVSDILGRQVEHMTRLVDDLLDVGRVTGGKIRLELAPLELSTATAQVVATWRSGGRFAQHHVRSDLAPVWVAADRARIEQVISNLLDNALKYTPAGGTIRLSVRMHGEEAILEVSDTGEGMTPELIARVFDLFVQGERDLAREHGGLGIGLTMAKRLVELHGGTITATSAGPGTGATLTVSLPTIEPPATPADAQPSAQESVSRCILIIEDNDDARESLVALLRLTGHEVHAAENGARGIEMAAAIAPDLVLVDIGLPDINGFEVARRLRANPATRHLRLVALTGYGTQEDRRRTLEAGFDEHIVKPVALEALEALMRPAGRAA